MAARTCDECVEWLYDDRPDQFASEKFTRGGKPIRRANGMRPLCRFCPKQPPDVPEADRTPRTAVELSEKNWAALRHYRECRATGRFPDDPLVNRNAALIRQAEDVADDVRRVRLALVTGTRGR